MLKIGLTGGIGSGKSTVCQLFSNYNIPIIDADIIARKLVEPDQPAFKQIVSLFGNAFLQIDGTLDRQKLRQLIFSDNHAKHQLEAILHPLIYQELGKQSNQQTSPYCLLVIPLLIEAVMHDLVDKILVINVHLKKQQQRLCQRDRITKDDALIIIKQQANQAERVAVADNIIDNNSTVTALASKVYNLHLHYTSLAKSCSGGYTDRQ